MMGSYTTPLALRDSLFLSLKARANKQLAFDIFEQNKHKPTFQYQTGQQDSIFVTLGNLFSKYRKHALISWSNPKDFSIQYEMLEYGTNEPKKLLQFSMGLNNFPSVSFLDVNGDQAKDLVMYWMPSSGCCPRNVYYIWTYHPIKHRFSEVIEVLNPVFYPKEKLIYAMNYGHFEQVELYKMRWRSWNQLDTLETLASKIDALGKPNPQYPVTKDTTSVVLDFKKRMAYHWGWYSGENSE